MGQGESTDVGGRPDARGVGQSSPGPLDPDLPTHEGLDQQHWQTCLRLARDLLLVGPDGADLKHRYLKVLIDDGLPRTERPLRVLIVGAGMAGLSAAYLLKQAGHEVCLIEANANRIGGRVKTFRDDPRRGMSSPFSDPLQYAEAGAMRIPDTHPLTLALVDKFGLGRRLFYNMDVDPDNGRPGGTPPPVTYRSFTGEVWRNGSASSGSPAFQVPGQAQRTWIRVNGIQVRRRDYLRNPSAVNVSFDTASVRRTASDLLDAALEPVHDYYSTTTPSGRVGLPLPAWIEGWARLIYDLDHLSMSQFLTRRAGLDVGAVDAIGTMENLTSRMPLAFIHSYLARSMINAKATYWEICGGSWRLPYAFEPILGDDIVFNRRVTRVEHYDPARPHAAYQHVGPDGPAVWIEATSEDGSERHTFTGDVAILTMPFSALRHVEIEPLLSYPKRRAIIELHYDSATKILLEFSRRWWEFTEVDWERELEAIEPGLYKRYSTGDQSTGAELLGAATRTSIPERQRSGYLRYRIPRSELHPADEITGGGSVTDNPNRFVYYPSHPVPGSRGGVVLASYTWADDAARWDSMDDDDRYAYALRGLQDLHGDRIEVFYTGHGATQSWIRDDYAFGEAAVFSPGQFTEHHPAIPTPEGPLHFAGEHTSLKHSWIEGALESGVRAAIEVHEH